MKHKKFMLVLLFVMPGALMAQQPSSQAPHASVTSLTSKDLPDARMKSTQTANLCWNWRGYSKTPAVITIGLQRDWRVLVRSGY
jgi:hypothetical protein